LIQILRIKAARPVNPGFALAKPGCVNPMPNGCDRHEKASMPLPIIEKRLESRAAGIHAAVTLSLFLRLWRAKLSAWQSGKAVHAWRKSRRENGRGVR